MKEFMMKNLQHQHQQQQCGSPLDSMNADVQEPNLRQQALLRDSLMDLKEVLAVTRWSRSTLYNRLKENAFPAPLKTGPRTRGWRARDVLRFINGCHPK